MKLYLISIFLLMTTLSYKAQSNATKNSSMGDISVYPLGHGPGSMMSRMVQGLGFRYYWASDSLVQADLDYRPSTEARSTYETLEHLYDLSVTILDFAEGRPSQRPIASRPADYTSLREGTLDNLSSAAKALNGLSENEISVMAMSFSRNGEQTDYSMYHAINGPIVDAITHVGQVVSFRRTSGNPIRKGVNVFLGTVD